MFILISDKPQRIIKNKRKLEQELGIEITYAGSEFTINGPAENEYVAEKVLQALDFGFPFSTALLIKEQDLMIEFLNIKDFTKRSDLERVRARIIGKEGKTLRALNELTKCFFEVKDNQVAIVGDPEYIKNAQDGMISLIRGAKQANVYAYLEKHQVQPVFDLGLKEPKKPKRRKRN